VHEKFRQSENGRNAQPDSPRRRIGPAILSSLARAAGRAPKKIKKLINVRSARQRPATYRALRCAALQQKRYSNGANRPKKR
jgi:hypothetical protein